MAVERLRLANRRYSVMNRKDPIDVLLKSYEALMPETAYLKKNPNRYPEVEKAVREIASLALDCDSEAKIEIKPDELTGSSLCLTIVSNLIVIDEIDKFCTSLAKADNFEVCPRTDGTVSLGMCFENAWIPCENK